MNVCDLFPLGDLLVFRRPLSLSLPLLLSLLTLTIITMNASAQQDPFSMHAPPGIVGRWDLTVQGVDGEHPAWFEVRQSGFRTLVGSYVGQFGSSRPIANIELNKDSFRFVVPPQWERTLDPIVVEGRIDGDRVTGEMNDEQGRTVKWQGTRAPQLAPTAVTEGKIVELFDGQSLAGWKARYPDREQGWEVRNGILTNSRPGNDLMTEKTFDDFRLVAEFRYPKGSNSGIYLRGRHEVQIEDNFGLDAESHRIGGVYGFLTPSINAAKPADEWQTYEITLVGRQVTIVLNGERVVDRQMIPGITGGAVDAKEDEPGPILLQGDHGPVEFRKVTLTELVPR